MTNISGRRRLSATIARLCALSAAAILAGCASAGIKEGAAPPGASAAPKSPARPVFQQADILGLDADGLDRLFGAPSLARREGVGEFRRYAFARCELIVILYANEAGASAVRSLDAAARRSGEAKPDLDDCLAGGLAAK